MTGMPQPTPESDDIMFRCLLQCMMDPTEGTGFRLFIEDFSRRIKLPTYAPRPETPLGAVMAFNANGVNVYRMAGANHTIVVDAASVYIERFRAVLSDTDQRIFDQLHEQCCHLDYERTDYSLQVGTRPIRLNRTFYTPTSPTEGTISRLNAAIEAAASDEGYNPRIAHFVLYQH